MREFVLPTVASSPATLAGARRRAEAGPGTLALLLLRRVAQWAEVRRQRRLLLGMSDHMLHDLGISRADAEGEAARPFWDLPERRR